MYYNGKSLYLPKDLTLDQLIIALKGHKRKIGGVEHIKALKVMSDNISITYSKGENKWVTRKL